jgi:hypothetical protein
MVIISTFKLFSTFTVAMLLGSLAATNVFAIHSQGSTDFAFGPISSINQGWVLAGHWMAYTNKSNITDSGFHSLFNMVMLNGSSPHIHKISNATVSDIMQQGNNTIYKGTISVTMKDGPVQNVPTNFTIGNNNTLAISMDPSKVNDHFGNAPIYGLVNNYETAMKMVKMMAEDPEYIGKWMPLIGADMMKGKMHSMKSGSNMSMMDHNMTDMMKEGGGGGGGGNTSPSTTIPAS